MVLPQGGGDGAGHIFVAEKQLIVLPALDEASYCRDLRLEHEVQRTQMDEPSSFNFPSTWLN